MYEYTDDCRTGIAQIDEEHRHFFDLCNRAVVSLEKAAELTEEAVQILEEIREYTKTHFAHEEEYMEAIQDPELEIQRLEHQAFVRRIDQIDVHGLNPESYRELVEFVVRWLYRHIIGNDTLIGRSLLGGPKDTEDGEKFAEGVVFSEKFKTGIAFIDDEHRELFAIVGRAYDCVHDDFIADKYDVTMEVLRELKEYTQKHFADEEEYMEKIGYAGLPAQKIAHEAFVEKLVQLDLNQLEYIDENPEEYLEEIINYLLDWLGNHILKMDKQIGM